jgi:beta-glucosidase/6-phospho-beta-glucosidase/beta-galactosidase
MSPLQKAAYLQSDLAEVLEPITLGTPWQSIYTPGLQGLSRWANSYYPNIDIFITECGTSVRGELSMTVAETINDTFRQNFFEGIVDSLTLAIEQDRLPIKAFLAWSLFDNFEWK